MSFYRKYILPRAFDWSMRNEAALVERERFVPMASGRVLEIGIGSGLNIPFYADHVQLLFGLEPSPELRRLAARRATDARLSIEFLEQSAEQIPLDNNAVDTVVSTWTLCTIPHAHNALAEMRRVLKPGGQLIFVEHGRSPDPRVHRWQNRLNPVWDRIGGGCNLNRRIDELIRGAGFDVTTMETGYIKGPKPLTYTFKGVAKPI